MFSPSKTFWNYTPHLCNVCSILDFGMMWMSPNQMMLQQGQGGSQSLSTEMLQMDPAAVQLENPYYPMAVPPSFESVPEQPMEIEG